MTGNKISRDVQDGIVTLTFDDPGKSVNTLSTELRVELGAVLDDLTGMGADLRGVVLVSAKKTFMAGADIDELFALGSDVEAAAGLAVATKEVLRRLETLGVPVVAAIGGAALGGGLELALAAHHRIAADTPAVKVGLPEVNLGLLPGGGGLVRVVRMLGIDAALDKVLLTGKAFSAAAAAEVGLVDEVVSPDQLISRAHEWIRENPDASQPWDLGKPVPGGGANDPAIEPHLPARTAGLRARHRGAPMAAPAAILCAAVEGTQVDIESAFEIETRYFVGLATSQSARNIIKGTFLDRQDIRSGASRPDHPQTPEVTTIAVVGAGMMGAGIALCAALAGIEVRLKDLDLAAAERGKSYATKSLAKDVAAGRRTAEQSDEIAARIRPTADYADLNGVDIIVEAVFENPDLKAKVFGEIIANVDSSTLLASNTSTLPITGLAASVDRPEDFIGLHFFSPVERMELIEIIVGEQTSDATLARAFDFARRLGKLPIVVGDGRGFFTSRVILTRLLEAAAMLGEGIAPATIEQASQQAGYPLGTLALLDELTLTLPHTIHGQFRDAAREAGAEFDEHPGAAVLEKMIVVHARSGRASGAGFYEYEDGRRKGLWSGLAEEFPTTAENVDLDTLKDRLLFAEAVDTARCLEVGVLRSAADANVGSLLGIGYPVWTGGTAQFVAGYPGGAEAFAARARNLADQFGPRFTPPACLVAAE